MEEKFMSRLNLTSWQRQRLRRQLAETRDVRPFRRTLAVLEFDHGRSELVTFSPCSRSLNRRIVAGLFLTSLTPASSKLPGTGRCWLGIAIEPFETRFASLC